jgi:hypothetical protein
MKWIEYTEDIDLEPGMQIKYDTGWTSLVGSVNCSLGTCDCCKDRSSVITHYRVLLTKEQMEEGDE